MLRWGIRPDGRIKVSRNDLEPWLPTVVIAALFGGFYALTLVIR